MKRFYIQRENLDGKLKIEKLEIEIGNHLAFFCATYVFCVLACCCKAECIFNEDSGGFNCKFYPSMCSEGDRNQQ